RSLSTPSRFRPPDPPLPIFPASPEQLPLGLSAPDQPELSRPSSHSIHSPAPPSKTSRSTSSKYRPPFASFNPCAYTFPIRQLKAHLSPFPAPTPNSKSCTPPPAFLCLVCLKSSPPTQISLALGRET